MFDQFKNLASLMGQAGQLREKMQQIQAELAKKTVQGDAGAGAVRVTVNGAMEVVGVTLDRAMVVTLAGQGDQADQQMVEDLILAATNDALARAKRMMHEEMLKVTGGMNLPGMEGLLPESPQA